MSDSSKFGFSPKILSLPNQQEYDGETFPLALRLEAGDLKQACGWIAENAGQIERQAATQADGRVLKLLHGGAFRPGEATHEGSSGN